MHRDDHLDLIDALVEGRSPDPPAARHLVATCPECGEAYRAHLAVKQAVESQPIIPLSEVERRRLRSRIWAGLDGIAAPGRATPLWYRIAPVAAALVLVIGVGGFLLSRGGGMATSATTLATASAPVDAYAPGPESSDQSLSGGSDTGGAGATTPNTLATMARSETTTTAGASAPTRLSSDDLAAAAAAFALEARRGELDADLDRCLAGDSLAPEEPFAEKRVIVDDQPAWLVAFGSPGDVSAVVVYGVEDCSVFFRHLR